MQIPLKQLNSYLKSSLQPIYHLGSDETLLVQQARDLIIKKAYQQGFKQRNFFSIEPGFDWQSFQSSTANLSLFSEKIIIDLRNTSASFNDKATKTLLNYFESPPEDHILIISTPKLTGAQKKSKWYKSLDKNGASITIWPISFKELPQWIATQLKKYKINANQESIQLLAEYTEGNLLATQQAIEKLAILHPESTIGINEMMSSLSDQNSFNVFDLAQYALEGDKQHIIRIMRHFEATRTEPTLILWALTREIRSLLGMHYQHQQGQSFQQILAKQWSSRKPLIQAALRRTNIAMLSPLIEQAHQIDKIIKGAATGNVWQQLTHLSLAIGGNKLISITL